MRIDWNSKEKAFEAQFAAGEQWSSDQQAAKDAGFKTSGPPEWKWFTYKVEPLNALKKNRPPSGLTISQEALAAYTPMQAQFEANEVVTKQLKAAKALNKKHKPKGTPITDAEGNFLPVPVVVSTYKPKFDIIPLTGPPCKICGDVLASYEYPDLCLWCSKLIDEKGLTTVSGIGTIQTQAP